jgi:hypothetical protein
MTKYSVFLLSFILAWGMIGCGRKSKRIYCKDLMEGVVASKTYYPLGKWGFFEVMHDGQLYMTTLNGPAWFDVIEVGDTITYNKIQ